MRPKPCLGTLADSVTTIGPGKPATVTVSVTGTVPHISLALSRAALVR
jgi:hypothetical protein